MVMEKVRKTIEERSLIKKGEHIVVGVSGGPDSVCLLYTLFNLSKDLDLSLYAVHINHCLRGRDADLDQEYTESLCKKLGIPCYVFSYDVKGMAAKEGLTTEEMGRLVRYQSFDRIREQIIESEHKKGRTAAVKIAVAQNLNDQAETVLMRIIRGTGTDGLSAMEYIRDGKIIRPLLDVSRDEIEEYCRHNGLSPRIDLTNLEPVYTRNKIRLELIPLLREKYNENILSSLSRLISIASEDKDFIYSHVDEALHEVVLCNTGPKRKLSRELYKKLHPAVRKRVISNIFKDLGLIQDINAVHLDRGDKMITEGKTGDYMDFPRGFGLSISYNEAVLFRIDDESREKISGRKGDFCYAVNLDGITQIPVLNAALRVTIFSADQMERVNYGNPLIVYLEKNEKIRSGCLHVRTRRSGDYITPLGMSGTKKLQDFFTDEKIKREDRDCVPLVCSGREVIWVIGRRINDNYKISKNTKEIVCLEYIPSL